MEFSIKYANGLFELNTTGAVTPSGYDHLYNVLTTHENWRPGSLVLSDEKSVDTSKLSTDDIIAIADLSRKYKREYGNAKITTLAHAKVTYGINRMWGVHSDLHWDAEVMVFRDREDALAWLSAE
ncbi:MAG: hypothetical protein KJO69_02545 [Gammaproteobacteria bacterium]|nr:hypothetical protein [Gammaproteobacteria bacterium]NNJ71588.1 hypothetical protein [Enterobacterales bacterium]